MPLLPLWILWLKICRKIWTVSPGRWYRFRDLKSRLRKNSWWKSQQRCEHEQSSAYSHSSHRENIYFAACIWFVKRQSICDNIRNFVSHWISNGISNKATHKPCATTNIKDSPVKCNSAYPTWNLINQCLISFKCSLKIYFFASFSPPRMIRNFT